MCHIVPYSARHNVVAPYDECHIITSEMLSIIVAPGLDLTEDGEKRVTEVSTLLSR